ncbi:hypothetical protein E8E12_008101 [Didymella heteroderae]|uniref:Uncharacterized protein n=1 Tax=Didymella heteroderae TaxID=1769908 RepID=A0A9P4WM80_9PLEO|nr:hypothetical protein E8E12_008101 [Didymella heteroderae]
MTQYDSLTKLGKARFASSDSPKNALSATNHSPPTTNLCFLSDPNHVPTSSINCPTCRLPWFSVIGKTSNPGFASRDEDVEGQTDKEVSYEDREDSGNDTAEEYHSDKSNDSDDGDWDMEEDSIGRSTTTLENLPDRESATVFVNALYHELRFCEIDAHSQEIKITSRDLQPRNSLQQNRIPHDVKVDDSDSESELHLEDFSSEMKGNIILILYTNTREYRALINEVVAGDATRMWECIRQVTSNDPVGSYFLSTQIGIGACLDTEEIVLNLLIRIPITEDMGPLSKCAQEKWIDEMCEGTEWHDSDDDNEDDHGSS